MLDGLLTVRRYRETHNTFTEDYGDERSTERTGDGAALIEFVEAIRETRQPIASIHDAAGTMRLCQAVYDAVRHKRDGLVPV